jgi:hypothetical protein
MLGGIYCDLEQAFDSVNYDILLSKLECYGIKDIYKAWYESYLYKKYQRVSIYDKKKKNLFQLGKGQMWHSAGL